MPDIDIAHLQAERDGYKAAYDGMNAEIGEARSRALGYQAAYEALQADYTRAQATIGELNGQVEGYRGAYDNAATELGHLRAYAAPVVRSEVASHRMGRPSIFVVTLPKSGTVFIGNTIRQSLDYDFTGVLVTPTFPKNIVWQPMVVAFMRGGMVYVGHMQPDGDNARALTNNGLSRIVLHSRDPRAAAWSWFNFIASRTSEEAHLNSKRADWLMSMSPTERMDTVIANYYTQAIDWLTGWMRLLAENPPFEFLLISHQELLDDEPAYFRKLFAFHGIEAEPRLAKKDAGSHFRKGDNAEWRTGVTQDQADRMIAMLTDELCAFYGFER